MGAECEGPIGGLATLHANAAMPNFVVQEIGGQVQPGPADKIWEEWLGFPAMRMVDGRFPLSQKPGRGFELSEALAKYPFGGTRPMARVSRTIGHGMVMPNGGSRLLQRAEPLQLPFDLRV